MEIGSQSVTGPDPIPTNIPKGDNPYLPFMVLRLACMASVAYKNEPPNTGSGRLFFDLSNLLHNLIPQLTKYPAYKNVEEAYSKYKDLDPNPTLLISTLVTDINSGQSKKDKIDIETLLGFNPDNPPFAADGLWATENLVWLGKEFINDVINSFNNESSTSMSDEQIQTYFQCAKLFTQYYSLVNPKIETENPSVSRIMEELFTFKGPATKTDIASIFKYFTTEHKIGNDTWDPIDNVPKQTS